MRKRRREPLSTCDARLEFYDRSVAHVHDQDQLVGYLSIRRDIWWTTIGHLWWKRDVDPEEGIEWLLQFIDGRAINFTDGVEVGPEDVDLVLTELDRGTFAVGRSTFTLKWLQGPKLEAARSEYGYGWAD